MQSLQRTNERFTSGIVNVPQNTPAYLLFLCKSSDAYLEAKQILDYHKVAFNEDRKHSRVLLQSKVDIDNQRVRLIMSQTRFSEIKRITSYRYVWFELDTKAQDELVYVLSVFAKYELPVYYHETMRGYHFFCVKPVLEDMYHCIMSELKPLNTACPMITLRIRPNKWVGEKEYFEKAVFQWPKDKDGRDKISDDTIRLATVITKQSYPLYQSKYILMGKYLLVNYEQNGEAGNL